MRQRPTTTQNEKKMFVLKRCVEPYNANETGINAFFLDLVKKKSSLIVCKEALAALPVMISPVKQLFTTAKTHLICK